MIPCHAIPQALHSRYTTALCFMTVLKCFHRQPIESSPCIHCYRYISLLPECSYNGKRPGKQDAYDHSDNVSVSHVVPPMNKLYTLLVRSGPFRSGAVRCSLNSNLRVVASTSRIYLKPLNWRASGTLYYAIVTVPNHIIATMRDFGSLPSGTIITMYDYDSTSIQFLASTNAFTDNSLIDVNLLKYRN